MSFKIVGRYRNNEYEEIDSAETKEDANYIRDEYKIAFGNEWLIKIVED